jgi:aminoglycoside/choline kinase family phosphotransferase
MSKLTIPGRPEELTADWLTRALRSSGTLTSAEVIKFESEPIAEGVGLMGQLACVKPHYDRPEAAAPRSLIAKFPAEAEENRDVANHFRFYEREIRFYEEIADEIDLRTPRCYYSAMDVEADRYVLLLEDLAPARVGDQLAGCSRQEAELAISTLAKFQATWWDSQRLEDLDWMPYANDPVNRAVEETYQDAWEPFLERFGDKVPRPVLEAGERLGARLNAIQDEMTVPPRTICHGDYRLDNLFFTPPESGDPLAVIDWQISFRGRGPSDVGYFMSQSLSPNERSSSEMDILRTYHRTLMKNGVDGYDFDRCLHDYRLGTLFWLVTPVIVGGTLDLSNERGLALATTIIERSVAAIVDLDAGELLPK